MKLLRKGKETTNTIIEIVRKKKLFSRYTILIISLLISACYFNLLQLPTEIVTGGTSGIAIIINAVTGMSPSLIIFPALPVFSFIPFQAFEINFPINPILELDKKLYSNEYLLAVIFMINLLCGSFNCKYFCVILFLSKSFGVCVKSASKSSRE